jgi:hypothetical protein
MQTFEIRHRHTSALLYSGGGESLRDVVDAAARAGANLDGANLAGANLDGASLAGANLAGANLDGASLAGAYLAGASLAGANLARANLAGANLAGAYLAGASLAGAALLGKRPILQIGPIGSRCAYLVAYITDAGVRLRAGCFSGSLDEFRAACATTHGDSDHGREYAAAISMIDAHAAIWTPVLEVSDADQQ